MTTFDVYRILETLKFTLNLVPIRFRCLLFIVINVWEHEIASLFFYELSHVDVKIGNVFKECSHGNSSFLYVDNIAYAIPFQFCINSSHNTGHVELFAWFMARLYFLFAVCKWTKQTQRWVHGGAQGSYHFLKSELFCSF